jgi:excisionase family DNA binding protein
MSELRLPLMETITVLEASRRSGVPAATIYRSIDAGELVGFRDGSEIKVRADDLALLSRRISG